MKKDEVLVRLKELKPIYEKDGVIICGIFGSLARGEARADSDIDIAYKIDREVFSSKYRGFACATKIAQIANELATAMSCKVDFISIDSTNKTLNEQIKRDLTI